MKNNRGVAKLSLVCIFIFLTNLCLAAVHTDAYKKSDGTVANEKHYSKDSRGNHKDKKYQERLYLQQAEPDKITHLPHQ